MERISNLLGSIAGICAILLPISIVVLIWLWTLFWFKVSATLFILCLSSALLSILIDKAIEKEKTPEPKKNRFEDKVNKINDAYKESRN